ncbi:hypothetical protein K3495_g9786 [Podosphaera aphanis]|nr:hypothetical protein K3495_g9786 [Podosphaera aphanis]
MTRRVIHTKGTRRFIGTSSWENMDFFSSSSKSSLKKMRLENQKSTMPRLRSTSYGSYFPLLFIILCIWITPSSAAFVKFQNCLSQRTLQDRPQALQLVPQFVNVVFNRTNPDHNLNVTVWVNITGSTVGTAPRLILPPANDTSYWNSNDTHFGGKVMAVPSPGTINKETTLEKQINFLSYQPYKEYISFCDHLVNSSCPLGPIFNPSITNRKDAHIFPSFGLSYNLYSSYALTSLLVTFKILYGDEKATEIGCISANITPAIGSTISGAIRFLPIVVLIFVGLATLSAAIWSPWGTSNIFHWTTNYGQDPDLIRLVTPGFADCLQYIQFIVLTAGLTINYPGFYQPIASKISWAALLFKQNIVEPAGSVSIIDGVYVTHGNYGLDKLSQLIGITQVKNVWLSMVFWLFAIIGVTLALIQIGFFVQWANRWINKTHEEDLRAKNVPFTAGNVIRIVLNNFLLPIVSISMFQLAVAPQSPAYTVGLAVLILILIGGMTIWLLDIILSTRPKSFLYDDLQTVLLYGSLYNTYSDHAVSFTPIPIVLTFVRGVAIGAVQASGIVQLVLLAICEVITILTIHGFRPYRSPTSMNAYHTFFATMRFTTVLLMISFTPSLDVSEGSKGWVGYCILLMHATVLILGFLLNAIQTIIEVAARLVGAGHSEGQARSGFVEVFGMRQLSKRLPRYDRTSGQSQFSNFPMLGSDKRKSYIDENGRMRSQSVGSTGILLGRPSLAAESIMTNPCEAIPPAATSFSLRENRTPMITSNVAKQVDPYYRPPRARRSTLEIQIPGAKSRGSSASQNFSNKYTSIARSGTPEGADESPSTSEINSPTLISQRLGDSPRRSKADYTTREVDFYYRVRGPALNANTPSRRIKTGPVDPTGPIASAASWFKWLIGGKSKDKGKGFEVVRGSRMQPQMHIASGSTSDSSPQNISAATRGSKNDLNNFDDEDISSQRLNLSLSSKSENNGILASNDSNLSEEQKGSTESGLENSRSVNSDLDTNEQPVQFLSIPTSHSTLDDYEAQAMSAMPMNETTNIESLSREVPLSSLSNIKAQLPTTQSQNLAPTCKTYSQMPFDRSNSKRRNSDISTNVSEMALSRNTSIFDDVSPIMNYGQNPSVHYVHEHQIHTSDQNGTISFLGSSAEVVDERQSSVSPMDNQS